MSAELQRPNPSRRKWLVCKNASRLLTARNLAAAVLIFFSASGTTALASSTRPKPSLPDARRASDPISASIAEASVRFGIPETWIRAVMHVESGGKVHVVSSKGAMGLMQIMPTTWATLRAQHNLGRDPFDARDNILAGTAFLRELHDRYGSPGFLAAYNAGPGRYEEYLATGRPLPIETQAYVAAIAPLIGAKSLGATITAALSAQSWSKSPLFLLRSVSFSDSDRMRASQQPNRRSSDIRVVDLSGLVPRAGSIFVQLLAKEPAR